MVIFYKIPTSFFDLVNLAVLSRANKNYILQLCSFLGVSDKV